MLNDDLEHMVAAVIDTSGPGANGAMSLYIDGVLADPAT